MSLIKLSTTSTRARGLGTTLGTPTRSYYGLELELKHLKFSELLADKVFKAQKTIVGPKRLCATLPVNGFKYHVIVSLADVLVPWARVKTVFEPGEEVAFYLDIPEGVSLDVGSGPLCTCYLVE